VITTIKEQVNVHEALLLIWEDREARAEGTFPSGDHITFRRCGPGIEVKITPMHAQRQRYRIFPSPDLFLLWYGAQHLLTRSEDQCQAS